LAVFSGGFVTSNTIVSAIASSTVISALDVGAVAASQQVTLDFDPTTISESAQEAAVTIYLPALPAPSAAAKSALRSSHKVTLPGSGLLQVVRIKLGAEYLYAKMVLTDTALGVRSDAVAAVTISKELLVRAVAMDVAQAVKTAVAATPDGELFELTSDTVSQNVSVPAPVAPLALPSGKLPLVLVHGIQAACVSESAAYQTTWKAFTQFFYSNAALQSKFKLYSFSYRTDSGIASNGEKLRQQLIAVFGTTKVVVLAHSMGGLVARYADASSIDGLKGLLTLNTPHHGTTNNIAGLSVGVNGLSKELLNDSRIKIPLSLLSKDGLSSQCFSSMNTQGATDLRWDYFDAIDSTNRCTGTSGNDFLCAAGSGLNRRTVPAKMFVYSSYRGANAEFIQKASGWILQFNRNNAIGRW
jgi:pimeloyl-ACP methyl ester carboxylesterase